MGSKKKKNLYIWTEDLVKDKVSLQNWGPFKTQILSLKHM